VSGAPNPPLVRNASSPKQAARAKREVKDRHARRQARMRQQLKTYEGREFLWELIGECGVFEEIAGTNETVRELLGQRRVGLRLMADAGAHPDLFRQMQTEAVARAERERRTAQAHAVDDIQEEQEQLEG